MSDEQPNGMLGGLPQTRPHRRSAKRPATPAVGRAGGERAATARPEPKATPRAKPAPPAPSSNDGVLGTAVQAAAELAEIGLMASARALRSALSRLPRP